MANTIPVQRTVQNRDLNPGTKIMVRGNIEFARLTRKVDGEALEAANQRRMAMGMQPMNKPYTTVTLTNVRIVPMKPGTKSNEEIYVEERFYKRTGDPANAPLHYTFDNKSPFDNTFYLETIENGKSVWNEFKPDGELANGVEVTLYMEVFQSKGFAQKGLAMRGIVLHEAPRYYQPSADPELTAAGIIIHRDPALRNNNNADAAAHATPDATPTEKTPIAVSTPAANVNPFMSQNQAPAAEPEGPWTCPTCGAVVPAGQQFCGLCGTKKAAAQPTGNQYASGGIRYDANNRGY